MQHLKNAGQPWGCSLSCLAENIFSRPVDERCFKVVNTYVYVMFYKVFGPSFLDTHLFVFEWLVSEPIPHIRNDMIFIHRSNN